MTDGQSLAVKPTTPDTKPATKPAPKPALDLLNQSTKPAKMKTRRGYGKQKKWKIINQNKNKIINFSLLGTNVAGLASKTESFHNAINNYSPSVITIQESKCKRPDSVKIPGYQVFEKIRTDKGGGGLLMAADLNINPMLIGSDTDDEVEVMMIQVSTGHHKKRIINGYRPQEDDDNMEILRFWGKVVTEIINSKDNDCMTIIQLDANAKVGNETIKNDPHTMTRNCKILVDILKRQNMTLLNAMNICTGTITRERLADNNVEKSVIDYVIVCDKMLEYVEEMTIDEDREFVLRRYIKTKKGIKIIPSDHNILFGKFRITFRRLERKIRKEIFHFKCKESQEMFCKVTSSNSQFTSCFNLKDNFKSSSNIFFSEILNVK